MCKLLCCLFYVRLWMKYSQPLLGQRGLLVLLSDNIAKKDSLQRYIHQTPFAESVIFIIAKQISLKLTSLGLPFHCVGQPQNYFFFLPVIQLGR